jgi:hypothetical protein
LKKNGLYLCGVTFSSPILLTWLIETITIYFVIIIVAIHSHS